MDDEIERVLAPGYVGDLAARSTADVRAVRNECRAVETKLSYLRRLVQGRHDIVAGEVARRHRGGDPGDVGQLVGELPDILADRIHAPGSGRLPATFEPGDVSGRLADRLHEILDDHGVADLGGFDDAELERRARALEALEGEVSELRRALFDRIDVLEAELTRRYREGEANVDDLLERADPA